MTVSSQADGKGEVVRAWLNMDKRRGAMDGAMSLRENGECGPKADGALLGGEKEKMARIFTRRDCNKLVVRRGWSGEKILGVAKKIGQGI